ncbi:MAG: LuxR C-terminal-related transcriptional regulator [Nocardioidaceae bacterium]
MQAIAQGLSNAEIGRALTMREATVKAHVSRTPDQARTHQPRPSRAPHLRRRRPATPRHCRVRGGTLAVHRQSKIIRSHKGVPTFTDRFWTPGPKATWSGLSGLAATLPGHGSDLAERTASSAGIGAYPLRRT